MQQILIFIWLLATAKPIRNSLWFLAGLSSVYILCGYYGYLALDKLNNFLHTFFPNANSYPDGQYYPAQLIVGLIFVIGGIVYYNHQKKSTKLPKHHPILEKLKNINPLVSFLIGGFISVSGFPFALPYLGILEKLTKYSFSHFSILGFVGIYNLAYALPMLIVLGIYLFFKYHVEDIENTLHLHAIKWNRIVNMLLFVGIGAIMMLDSIVFLVFNHPLFKSKFF